MSRPPPPPPPPPPPQHWTNGNAATGGGAREEEKGTVKASNEMRCHFWIPNKRRHCANSPLPLSLFCGNHDPSAGDRRLRCPLDPSHFVSKENLDSHLKRCPSRKQILALEAQAYYSKGMNSGSIVSADAEISSEAKRSAIYGMRLSDFLALVKKINSLHTTIARELQNSYLMPDACEKWLRRQIDRKIPYQERHVSQQASILGNMEKFGMLHRPKQESMRPVKVEGEGDDCAKRQEEILAVVEFGAGRGYLTHMLVDSYGIQRIFFVERRSYKLKADRSLRQNESIHLERLRIDNLFMLWGENGYPMLCRACDMMHFFRRSGAILEFYGRGLSVLIPTQFEDLNLHAVESLNGHPFLAIGKHLCGNATDLTVKCCLPEKTNPNKKEFSSSHLQGIALTTCCHHLCQWKHYLNTKFFLDHGITKHDFNAITWFSSWAVDAAHSSDPSNQSDSCIKINGSEENGFDPKDLSPFEGYIEGISVEETIRNIRAVDRAAFGFKCKDIIDMGRVLWLREHGLDAKLVKYVPSRISPENHLLLAKKVF